MGREVLHPLLGGPELYSYKVIRRLILMSTLIVTESDPWNGVKVCTQEQNPWRVLELLGSR